MLWVLQVEHSKYHHILFYRNQQTLHRSFYWENEEKIFSSDLTFTTEFITISPSEEMVVQELDRFFNPKNQFPGRKRVRAKNEKHCGMNAPPISLSIAWSTWNKAFWFSTHFCQVSNSVDLSKGRLCASCNEITYRQQYSVLASRLFTLDLDLLDPDSQSPSWCMKEVWSSGRSTFPTPILQKNRSNLTLVTYLGETYARGWGAYLAPPPLFLPLFLKLFHEQCQRNPISF